jgi:hypothetical protein
MANKLKSVVDPYGHGAKITGILVAGQQYYVSFYKLFADGYLPGYNDYLIDRTGETEKEYRNLSSVIREINKYGAPVIGIKDYGVSASTIDEAVQKIAKSCDYEVENVKGKGKMKIDERSIRVDKDYVGQFVQTQGEHYQYILRKRGSKKSNSMVRVPSKLYEIKEEEKESTPVKSTVNKLSIQKMGVGITLNSPKKRKSPGRRIS